jgi:hypothetical protein
MAVAPINYQALLTQLDFSPLQQGLAQMHQNKMDRAYLDRQAMIDDDKRKAAAQADARQNAFRDRWRTVSGAPSSEGWASLRADFPEYASDIGSGEKAADATRTELNRGVAFDVYGRLTAGGANLVPQIDASLGRLSAAGAPLGGFQTVRDLAASGKPQQMAAAQRIAAMLAAQYSGGNFGEVVNSLGRDAREAELQPDKARKADADADWAETRASYAPQVQQATLLDKQTSVLNRRDVVAKRGERMTLSRRAAARADAAAARAERKAAGGGQAGAGSAGVSIRPGEQTASDGKGNKFVIRNGQWVKAK